VPDLTHILSEEGLTLERLFYRLVADEAAEARAHALRQRRNARRDADDAEAPGS
jgi:hypothetical protein